LIKLITQKLENLQEKRDNTKVYLRNNKTLLYLAPTAFFIISMLAVFTHGIIINNSIGFDVIQIYEPQPFGRYELTVTTMRFNPEESIHRMDVFFDTTSHNVDLFNYQLDINAVALRDPSQPLNLEIVRVTSQFFVIYIRDLPADFGAIRKDIFYFASENQSATITIRTEEDQSVIDNELQIETDRMTLMPYALTNDIRILELEIADFENEIHELEEEIVTNLSHIEQLESDMAFQVGEQLATSRSRIQSFLTRNSSLESDIEALENAIEEIQSYIESIVQTINDL